VWLTHGGFYEHFESKEQVIEESLALAIGSMVQEGQRTLSASPGGRGLDNAIAGSTRRPVARSGPERRPVHADIHDRAVTMARVVTDPAVSTTILRQARKHLTPKE